MSGRKEFGSKTDNNLRSSRSEFHRIVQWSQGHPLQSSVGVLAAIIAIIGTVVDFSRFNDFKIIFGAILLAAGLVWALFAATKVSATWEKKIAIAVIILCMLFGGALLVWPDPDTVPPEPVSLVQYSLTVTTQSPVNITGGNDNVSTQPESRSAVEATLGDSCQKHFRLNERGTLMAAGSTTTYAFEAPTNCRFTNLILLLQQDNTGRYDDWAFDRIQILRDDKIIVDKAGQWAIGDSTRTHRDKEITINFIWSDYIY